jgi:hypothetical protein
MVEIEAPPASCGKSSQFYHDGKIGWLLKSHLKVETLDGLNQCRA